MHSNYENIANLLSDPKFIEFHKLGLIDDLGVRNLQIKLEFHKLRESFPVTECIYQLADKFFLSFNSINTILYRDRRRKPSPLRSLLS